MGGKSFYSNGKLLLTGEYLVLNGAKALAVPLKFGQSLTSEPNNSGKLIWETIVNGDTWLNLELMPANNFQILNVSDNSKTGFLLKALKAASILNPDLLEQIGSCSIVSRLNFDINWGLGSSSTLITNIANLAGIDPFALHDMISNGSGYDIAAAQSNVPIIFRIESGKREYHTLGKAIPFRENISFIYLGQKQSSDISVSQYLKNSKTSDNIINEISLLTERLINSSSIMEMAEIIRMHEKIISSVIGIEPVQKRLFPDFDGSIKSLGAWGGDFIMAVSSNNSEYIKNYFNSKNLNIIFGYDEIAI